MSKKDWIDKAFKDAVDMPKAWYDPDNPQRKWVNGLFEKKFEVYKQTKSKVKPCEEKVNWWIGTPGEVEMININEMRKELEKMGKEDSIEFVANKLAEAKIFNIVCASNFGRGPAEIEEITSAIVKRASEIEDKVFKKWAIGIVDNLYRALSE